MQDLAELGRAIRIGCPAQGYDAPIELRMSQDVAAAPKCLVVRMRDYNSAPGARVWLYFIEWDDVLLLVALTLRHSRGHKLGSEMALESPRVGQVGDRTEPGGVRG